MNAKTNIIPGQVYHMDFSAGKLVPLLKTDLLPVGSLVTYEDIKNPQKRYAVIGDNVGEWGYGQKAVCEDGHETQVHASSVDRYGRTGGAWQFVRERETGEPQVLDAGGIEAFVAAAAATGAKLKIEREAAQAAETIARGEEKTALLSQFSYLERVGATKKSGHALGAANLRRVLARTFPGVVFSVKSDSYSGGNSIDVGWTDGPTSDEVKRYSDPFQDSDFNSMEDISEARNSIFPDLFGGAKHVAENRHLSGETLIKVAADMGYTVTVGKWNEIEGVEQDISEMIYREARSRSFYVAPVAVAPVVGEVAPGESSGGIAVRLNAEKGGVEIVFPAKPAPEILESVKAAGFRWSGFAACWWAKQTPGTLAFANSLKA